MHAWTVFEKDDEVVAAGRKAIGAGMRSARLRLRMTQRQLGDRALLSQSAISRLETGRLQGLRLRTLARLVGILCSAPGHEFPDGPPVPTRRLPNNSAT